MRLRWHKLMLRLGATRRVRLARLRAAAWAVVGVISFPLGWAQSVVLVWIASVYANVASEMATGEAADDRALVDRLERIERAVRHPEWRPRAARPPAFRPSRLTRGYPGRAGVARDAHRPRRPAVMATQEASDGRTTGRRTAAAANPRR